MQRFALLNVVGAGGLAAATISGALDPVIANPSTLTVFVGLIGAMSLSALYAIILGHRPWAFFCRDIVTALALIGTVWGLIGAMTHLDFKAEAVATMQVAFGGLGLALWSTLSGIVAHVWLALCLFVTRPVGED